MRWLCPTKMAGSAFVESNWPDHCIYVRMQMSALPGLAPFVDPAALVIVGGGTLLAVVLRHPASDLWRSLKSLRTLARSRFDVEPLLGQISALKRIAVRHGVIALDRSVIADADVRAAVSAVVDGMPSEFVRTMLEQRLTARIERHRSVHDVWGGAAEIAPAMGMIGTLIGLVAMFVSMKDPAAIGDAMAVALLTTLYGALLATVLLLPISVRLRRQARHEANERARLIGPLTEIAQIEPGVVRPVREVVA